MNNRASSGKKRVRISTSDRIQGRTDDDDDDASSGTEIEELSHSTNELVIYKRKYRDPQNSQDDTIVEFFSTAQVRHRDLYSSVN